MIFFIIAISAFLSGLVAIASGEKNVAKKFMIASVVFMMLSYFVYNNLNFIWSWFI